MGFSLPNFLRRTPSPALASYFAVRGFSGLEDIDWKAEGRALNARLRAAIEALPDRERDNVFDDFERAAQLCDEVGQRSLQSVISPDLLEIVRASDSHETRALQVLLTDPQAFDRALATAYADRFRNGRSWSGFLLPAGVRPQPDQNGLPALTAEVSQVFKDFDGTGRRLKIDNFARRGWGSDGQVTPEAIHYTIYVEGLPESDIEFDSDHAEPVRRTRKPVVEATICYELDAGHIDVVSKGGRRVREAIAGSFASCLLDPKLALEPVSRRQLLLDRLKHPIAFPRDQQDGIRDVRVTLLRLANMGSGSERLTIEKNDAVGENLYDASARWFGDRDPLKHANWQVMQAKLRIVFYPEQPGKRDKQIIVDLRMPNGSNLKDQTRRHQIIADRYLARWGLVEGG